jgi:peptidoglycan hydrolase-like protein with peptidoglycan-binding domain
MTSPNEFPDDIGGVEPDAMPRIYSTLDRWRFALVAFAVLMTVIAVGVLSDGSENSSSENSSSENSNLDVVVDTSSVPLITVPLERTLELGMKGDDVVRLQQRLKDLRFDPGPIDGEFGQNTVQAMWAFEKLVMSVPRERATGVVTSSTWTIMQSNLIIKPRRIADSPSHVEIYLPEQVMIVFKKDEPVLITHISSGTGESWCEEVKIDPGEDGNKTDEQIKIGICGDAITPPGIFYFYNRRTGMRETKLGSLYNPVYFNYNIAVHGAILVPLKPASHGCVRIPMSVARYFPALVAYGDRVYVFDGIKEPEEYGSPIPPFDKPDPNYTTIATETTLPTIDSTTIPTVTTLPTVTTVGSVTSTTTSSSTTTTTTP